MSVGPRASSTTAGPAPRAFSLAELLVVVGIVTLLIALMLPPLQMARRKTMQTACSAQLQQLGRALEGARADYGFYPLWDDGGDSIRYTWIDVLMQNQLLSPSGAPERSPGGRAIRGLGYCPADRLPDPLNSARHQGLIYPPRHNRAGIDYSYGIGVPLSAGGWAWQSGSARDGRPRRFPGYERGTSGRVLAGDAVSAAIYNLSGDALRTGIWNAPTQFDNTIAWGRHPGGTDGAQAANLLFQDGHVESVGFHSGRRYPVNTSRYYVWHAGESIHVDPEDRYEDNWYPCVPPASTGSGRGVYPAELDPRWYTRTHRWTRVKPK